MKYQQWKSKRYKPFTIPKIGGRYTYLCETMNAYIYEHSSNGTVAIVEEHDVYICCKGNCNSIMSFSIEDIQ